MPRTSTSSTVHDVRLRFAEKIRALDRALEDVIPAIQWLLDVEMEGSVWMTMDAAVRRQRVLDAMKRLLVREAQARPVVLIFEDLQWVDAETQSVLNGIIEILPIARMMLVATYRPEYEHRWSNRSYYAQVRVEPLSADDAQRFIEAVLGTHESLVGLKRALLARTEGNPFFLEETAQTLWERHALTGERSDFA